MKSAQPCLRTGLKLHSRDTQGEGTNKKEKAFSSSQVASLEREVKQMQKCMRKKIAYAYKNGTSADVMGEQFIEFPRALCNIDNLPVKGQKILVTGFYKGRYSNINMQSFPCS